MSTLFNSQYSLYSPAVIISINKIFYTVHNIETNNISYFLIINLPHSKSHRAKKKSRNNLRVTVTHALTHITSQNNAQPHVDNTLTLQKKKTGKSHHLNFVVNL